MDTDRLRLAVAREASATAHALTLKGLRRKTIPLRQMAEEVTDAVEVRIEHLFATSQLGQVACGADCAYCCYVPRVLVTLPELARIASACRPGRLKRSRRSRRDSKPTFWPSRRMSHPRQRGRRAHCLSTAAVQSMTLARSCAAASMPTTCRSARHTAKPALVRRGN